MTFVGMVRAISPQTTNVTFRLDDGTGVIEVKLWLDADKQDEAHKHAFPLDSYVRVWGRLKSFNNKRHVGAHVIKPVKDYNEVQYHLLESTYVHLFLTRGAPGTKGQPGGDDDSMFVDGGNDSRTNQDLLRGLSPKAKKFFTWLSDQAGGSEGIHINLIAQGAGLSIGDALAAAEELVSPGRIYTTVDDETYAVLDY